MDQSLKNKVLRKILTKRLIGKNKAQVDTVKGWFPSDEESEAEDIIRDFAKGSEVPLRKYGGGARDNVHLTEAYEAVKYLYENDGVDLRVKTMYEQQYNAVVRNAEEE